MAISKRQRAMWFPPVTMMATVTTAVVVWAVGDCQWADSPGVMTGRAWPAAAFGAAPPPPAALSPQSAALGSEAEGKFPGRPELKPEQQIAIVAVARGYTEALWTGRSAEDVAGAALRDLKMPVGVALRRRGLLLGRGQSGRGGLLECLREAVAGAVAEAKSSLAANSRVTASELRLEVELAGEMVAIAMPAGLAQAEPAAATGKAPRAASGDRISDVALAACRRGLRGLAIEYRASRASYIGLTFPGEVITDNLAPVGMMARTLLRAKIPGHLTNRQLQQLVEDKVIGFWSFASVHLIEGDAKVADPQPKPADSAKATVWSSYRGHRLVEVGEVSSVAAQAAAYEAAEHLFGRYLRSHLGLPHGMLYYPSSDLCDATAGTPMENAMVAWGMAEAARRWPDKPRLEAAALDLCADLRRRMQDLPVSVNAVEDFKMLPTWETDPDNPLAASRKPSPWGGASSSAKAKAGQPRADKSAVGKSDGPAPEASLMLSVLPEAGSDNAHVGSVAVAALAMTRLPAGRAHDLFAGDKPEVRQLPGAGGERSGKAEPPGGTVEITKPRERLMVALVWMQNRQADISRRGGSLARPDDLLPPRPGSVSTPDDRPRWEAGTFRTWFPPALQVPGQDQYAGPAVLALATYAADSDNPKAAAKARGYLGEALTAYYKAANVRGDWNAMSWQIPAFALVAQQANAPARQQAAVCVLNMADRMLTRQVTHHAEPDQVGAFPPDGQSLGLRTAATTALGVMALAAAHCVAKAEGDRSRAERYAAALRLGVRYLLQVRYKPEDMYYVRDSRLSRGGLRSDVEDNSLHQVNTALAIIALTQAADVLAGLDR